MTTTRLAAKLTELRHAAQLRQADVCKIANISPRTMTIVEHPETRGDRIPRLKTIQRITKAYGITHAQWCDIVALWAMEALGPDARFVRIEPILAKSGEMKDRASRVEEAVAAFSQLPPRDQQAILRVMTSPRLLHACHSIISVAEA